MTLEYIAAIIESCYYNGRVQNDDHKMGRDDFLQMARAANGTVMRDLWYDERQKGGSPMLYFADSVTTERFQISKKGRYRVVQFEEGGAVKLPNGMGIFRVSPAMAADDDTECEDEFDNAQEFTRGQPGMESSFGTAEMLDDLDEAFFVPVANKLRLFGFDQAKFAEVDYIKNDENLDIPEGPAWTIIMQVLGPVLKVVGYPVDVTDDSNPNVVTIKKALADPQGL
jgi:hypothetical protein